MASIPSGWNREYWKVRVMMAQYDKLDIQEMPMGSPLFRRKVERFLEGNGLRLEAVDAYFAIENADGEIIAGGGLQRDIIKCIAVSESARSGGVSAPLVSRLIAEGTARGYESLKVFTKPENRAIFESMGFRQLAAAPKAILMENGRGLEKYCGLLSDFRGEGRTGVIVLHANPLTRGHLSLIERAAADCDILYLIPVAEPGSRFSYEERSEMLLEATLAIPNVEVLPGSDYQISAATFPTYFLKDLSDAAETQIRLDLDLFVRHIAPALGATVRYVGAEPSDPLTARYNALMQEFLPAAGVEVRELPRLSEDGVAISASRVRAALDAGAFRTAAALTPPPTWPFLLGDLADRALRLELDAPLKPGLVGPDGPGAHADMDYALMQRGIAALRPFWPQMAQAPSARALVELGRDAEAAMLTATGGVNTHRGAIFALGLALSAAASLEGRFSESVDIEQLMQNRMREITQTIFANQLKDSELSSTRVPQASHGAEAVARYGAKGARAMAADGYADLFADALPYYQTHAAEPFALQRTLLRIMAKLDDTCILHRAGPDAALAVKRDAAALEADFSEDKLTALCARYAEQGISPGGAADMLALTIFIYTITC